MPKIYFLALIILLTIFFVTSNFNFRLRGIIFGIAVAIMLISTPIIYKLFGIYSAFYSIAAYYSAFRVIHYFIDVKQDPSTKNSLISYLSFLLFFPCFSSGPIEKIQNLHPKPLTKEKIFFGLRRALIGIIKLAIYNLILLKISPVDFSLSNIGSWLIFSAYGGAIKLFVLLWGSWDIVIGLSALLGFKVSENFPKIPYLQRNLTQFWLNWQATLVNWIIGYIYFPLCKNRKYVYLKTMFIIMIIGWGHLFFNTKDFPTITLVMYYTLWGIFLGGTFALSKSIGDLLNKPETKEWFLSKSKLLHKFFYTE
ncbi:MAG: MBOAT family O-acyltransferase, partial [Nanoarchaeota archaeon]